MAKGTAVLINIRQPCIANLVMAGCSKPKRNIDMFLSFDLKRITKKIPATMCIQSSSEQFSQIPNTIKLHKVPIEPRKQEQTKLII